MSNIVNPDIERYAEEHSSDEPAYFASIAEETHAATTSPQMMVGKLEGRFLKMLVHMLQPQQVLEIGTFTGYSSLSMAEALPPGGLITTCEISEKHAAIAKRYIASTPYADRIAIRLGPALETIATLPGPFDLVFIDADKDNYLNYFEATLPKLSERGVIAVDNVLWSGAVLNPADTSPQSVAIRTFNDRVRQDQRVEGVMLPIRDGITLLRRAR